MSDTTFTLEFMDATVVPTNPNPGDDAPFDPTSFDFATVNNGDVPTENPVASSGAFDFFGGSNGSAQLPSGPGAGGALFFGDAKHHDDQQQPAQNATFFTTSAPTTCIATTNSTAVPDVMPPPLPPIDDTAGTSSTAKVHTEPPPSSTEAPPASGLPAVVEKAPSPLCDKPPARQATPPQPVAKQPNAARHSTAQPLAQAEPESMPPPDPMPLRPNSGTMTNAGVADGVVVPIGRVAPRNGAVSRAASTPRRPLTQQQQHSQQPQEPHCVAPPAVTLPAATAVHIHAPMHSSRTTAGATPGVHHVSEAEVNAHLLQVEKLQAQVAASVADKKSSASPEFKSDDFEARCREYLRKGDEAVESCRDQTAKVCAEIVRAVKCMGPAPELARALGEDVSAPLVHLLPKTVQKYRQSTTEH